MNNGRKLRGATERKGLTGSVVGLPFDSAIRPSQEAQRVAHQFYRCMYCGGPLNTAGVCLRCANCGRFSDIGSEQ